MSKRFLYINVDGILSLMKLLICTQMSDKILSTGKYLNVVRECGKKVQFPDAREIIYDPFKKEYVQQIESVSEYIVHLILPETSLLYLLSINLLKLLCCLST